VARPASLARRINAATIDALVIVALAVGLPHAIPDAVPVAAAIRAALLFGVMLLLEPLLIRCFGRTVGQAALGLWVVPDTRGARLGFFRLALRYWTKLLLGMPSLFYIRFTHRKQALHDRAFGTAVLHVPRGAPAPQEAKLAHPSDPTLPSAARRFVVFLGWWIVAELAFAVAIIAVADAVAPEPAAYPALEGIYNLVSLVLLLAMAHLGAAGRLLGARRIRIADAA
jgi:uncharacterized RDD family membrane protein YckC